MINERTFLRLPIPFKNNIFVIPPSVNDIVKEDNFGMYRKLLTLTQEEIEDEYVKQNIEGVIPTPLQYILKHSYEQPSFCFLVENAFFFFLEKTVKLVPLEEKILIQVNEKEWEEISAEEYFDFQNIIRESLGEKPVERPDPNEHPKIKRMKAKARYRDKIKAQKGDGLSLSSCLVLICCMGIGLNPLNIGEISYASINALIGVYQDKEKYHLDIDTLLAGGKNIKPKYWIKNLD